jgi:hypothetical protein
LNDFILGSFSADLPLTIDFNQGSDELQPCIEDIRHEIDRLRREEQLLRERFLYKNAKMIFH